VLDFSCPVGAAVNYQVNTVFPHAIAWECAAASTASLLPLKVAATLKDGIRQHFTRKSPAPRHGRSGASTGIHSDRYFVGNVCPVRNGFDSCLPLHRSGPTVLPVRHRIFLSVAPGQMPFYCTLQLAVGVLLASARPMIAGQAVDRKNQVWIERTIRVVSGKGGGISMLRTTSHLFAVHS